MKDSGVVVIQNLKHRTSDTIGGNNGSRRPRQLANIIFAFGTVHTHTAKGPHTYTSLSFRLGCTQTTTRGSSLVVVG